MTVWMGIACSFSPILSHKFRVIKSMFKEQGSAVEILSLRRGLATQSYPRNLSYSCTYFDRSLARPQLRLEHGLRITYLIGYTCPHDIPCLLDLSPYSFLIEIWWICPFYKYYLRMCILCMTNLSRVSSNVRNKEPKWSAGQSVGAHQSSIATKQCTYLSIYALWEYQSGRLW